MKNIEEKLQIMFEMQDRINCETAGKNWRDLCLSWHRAIWLECAELIDHFGWKWWKLQMCDIDQVKMEIVDIWHFGMSELLSTGVVDGQIMRDQAETAFRAPAFIAGVVPRAEKIAYRELSGDDFCCFIFFGLCRDAGMTFDDLFKMYVGKNALNEFRQANGYKDGTYIKIWGDVEDNVVLTDILRSLGDDFNHVTAAQEIERKLEDKYQEVMNHG